MQTMDQTIQDFRFLRHVMSLVVNRAVASRRGEIEAAAQATLEVIEQSLATLINLQVNPVAFVKEKTAAMCEVERLKKELFALPGSNTSRTIIEAFVPFLLGRPVGEATTLH